jgi:hypothetical protein
VVNGSNDLAFFSLSIKLAIPGLPVSVIGCRLIVPIAQSSPPEYV